MRPNGGIRESTLQLPVGYYTFHPKQLFNFQLNRWHSLGYLPYDAMVVAGRKVSDFATWTRAARSRGVCA